MNPRPLSKWAVMLNNAPPPQKLTDALQHRWKEEKATTQKLIQWSIVTLSERERDGVRVNERAAVRD